MSVIIPYNRERAVEYAKQHALVRDYSFFDFTDYGGNCTAYISQCLFAANGIMNPAPYTGWYYYGLDNRSPSWSGVEFFYEFLTNNSSLGPFARLCKVNEMQLGDLVQLKFYGYKAFTHTLIVTKVTDRGAMRSEKNLYVSANTFDALNKNLTQYNYKEIRFLKVLGVYSKEI